MEVLLGGAAGLATGVLGSFVAAIAAVTARRARNARLVRRGEPPIRDVVFQPLWLLFGLAGFIAGVCWTWVLGGGWQVGAIAGAGVPAVVTIVSLLRR